MYKLLSLIKNLKQDPETNELLFQFGKLGQPVGHSEENDWIFIEESDKEKSKCLVISLRDNEVHIDIFKSNIEAVQLVQWAFQNKDDSLYGIRPFLPTSFLKHTFNSNVELQLTKRRHRSIHLDVSLALQNQLPLVSGF